jgi:hypothetical protein
MSQKNPIVPEGWYIQNTKRHYDLFFFFTVGLHLLVGLIPQLSKPWPPADVSYTLRHEKDGMVITVRLDGDHAPEALVEYVKANGANSNLQERRD